VSPEQLAVIEQQRTEQANAYEQERLLLQQQNAQQTSAMQAMLNVYGKQVEDLQATRQQQATEQQNLLQAQEQQAKLIESDRVRVEADMAQQRSRTNRYTNRTNAVLSNRRQARNRTRVFDSTTTANQIGQIFGKRNQL
jgi:hypothetical protein